MCVFIEHKFVAIFHLPLVGELYTGLLSLLWYIFSGYFATPLPQIYENAKQYPLGKECHPFSFVPNLFIDSPFFVKKMLTPTL